MMQLALEEEQSAVVPMLMARQVPVVHALAPLHALTLASVAVGRVLASMTASSVNASISGCVAAGACIRTAH